MKTSSLQVTAALLAGAVLVALPAALLRFPPGGAGVMVEPRPVLWEAAVLLRELEVECDPGSPTNEYYFSLSAQPTELKRGQILAALVRLGEPALAEVRARLSGHDTTEFQEMLVLAAFMLGDQGALLPAACNMVDSEYPAVRIVTARVLRKLKDPQMADYFHLALQDPRAVRNDACGIDRDPYYPVRTIAALALKDMGIGE